MNYNGKLFQTNTYKLYVIVFVVIIIGVFFRLANIDNQIYSHDETYTSLRVSGYTQEEVVSEVYESNVIHIKTLQRYQFLNSDKTVKDTIKSIALEDAMHPPLYFIAIRYWAKLWSGIGNRIVIFRSFSILFSLLAFPCLYWLCQELFNSSLVGWVAIALFSISPFHVVYAQEARQYSLITVIILLSSASLLRAIRVKTNFSWIIYGVTAFFGLYTHLFYVFVPLGHGFYVWAKENFRLKNRSIKPYLLSFISAFLLYIPWIVVILANLAAINRFTTWSQKNVTIAWLAKKWMLNLSRMAIDWNSDFAKENIFIYLVLILAFYSIYYLCRKTDQATWLFIVVLILSTFLGLIASDLLRDSIISASPRYLVPCYLGLQVAIAYLVTNKIFSLDNSIGQQRLWSLIFCAILTVGIFSCYLNFNAQTWWNKYNNRNFAVAKTINQAERPLLISESTHGKFGSLMSLSYLLDDDVELKLLVEPNAFDISQEFSHFFLFIPSKQLVNNMKERYKVEKIKESNLFIGYPDKNN